MRSFEPGRIRDTQAVPPDAVRSRNGENVCSQISQPKTLNPKTLIPFIIHSFMNMIIAIIIIIIVIMDTCSITTPIRSEGRPPSSTLPSEGLGSRN